MLKQKFMLSYSSKLGIQFLQIFSTIAVARIAGATTLGTITFALSYVSLIYFFFQFGLPSAHVKIMNEGHDKGKCIGTYTRLVQYNVLVFIIGFAIVLFSQRYIFKVPFESQTHLYVVLIFFIIEVVNSLLGIPNSTFIASTEQAKQDIPSLISNTFLYLSRVVLVFLGVRALGLALFSLLAVLIIVPITLSYYKKYRLEYTFVYDPRLAKRYIKIAIPFFFMTTVMSLTQYLDKVLLQFFTSSAQVGYYGASFRLGSVIMTLSTSLGLLFFPLFSKAIADNDLLFVINKVKQYDRFSVLFIFPTILFIMIYSDSIVYYLLGKEFTPAIIPMSITTLALYFRMHNTPYSNILNGAGNFRVLVILNASVAIFYVTTLVLFVHPHLLNLSVNGASIALGISNLGQTVATVVLAKRQIPKIKLLYHIKSILVICILALPLCFLYRFFRGDYTNYLFRFSFPFLYFITIYALLYITKIVRRIDIDTLLTLLNIKQLRDYIKHEIHP